MKKTTKALAVFLSALCCVSFTSCSLLDTIKDLFPSSTSETEATTPVEKISSNLLDGKVANFLSAEGIGIENKDAQVAEAQGNLPTSSIFSAFGSNVISANADEGMGQKSKQAVNELVKMANGKVHDIRFHGKDKGSYREWNKRFSKHHHNKMECGKTDCDEISDEILAEEETNNTPTIVSLGARVNKLYSNGKFTFVCISAAIEGDVSVFTHSTRIQNDFEMSYLAGVSPYPTLINVNDHRDEGMAFTVSYININDGENKGMILVKRSENETGYHQANYWSDDYNQSYVIDNTTGQTYSLAQFPYIYSVNGDVISIVKEGQTKLAFDYYKISTESGELSAQKLELPESDSAYASLVNGSPMIDVYGNIVFPRAFANLREGSFPGLSHEPFAEEIRYGQNVIFGGTNGEIYLRIRSGEFSGGSYDSSKADARAHSYLQALRYHKGSDGLIYRIDYKGSYQNIPIKVLNENGEWQDVPSTTDVTFPYTYGTIVQISPLRSWFMITRISGGNAYFSTALWGEPAGFLHEGSIPSQMQGEYVGVAKMPVNGGTDQTLIALTNTFIQQNKNNKAAIRVGNTAMVYEEDGKAVLWNRLTDEKSYIENASITNINNYSFMIANKYVSYGEETLQKPWALESFSDAPLERKVVLDEYYQFLIG